MTRASRLIQGIFLGMSFHALALEKAEPQWSPPHELLPPTFWERNGFFIIVAGILFGALFTWLFLILSRTGVTRRETPLETAKRVLSSLASSDDNATTSSRVSRALKNYLRMRLKLFPGELTTGEMRLALRKQTELPAPLIDAVESFLIRCDETSFSTTTTGDGFAPAQTALKLLDEVERALMPAPPVIKPPRQPGVVA